MNRPVVRAGIAAAGFSALTGLCVLAGATFLSGGHVAWLVKPIVGIAMGALQPEYIGLGTGSLVVSVALGGIGVVAAAFYLDHCLINQPNWSVIGGWGLLLSGLLTLTLQEVVSPDRTMFIDVDHSLWPIELAPAAVGAVVILVSWWRAPEFFFPHASRWTLAVLVGALALGEVSTNQLSLGPTLKLVLFGVIVSAALVAGSWVTQRLASMHAGSSELLGQNQESARPGGEAGPVSTR